MENQAKTAKNYNKKLIENRYNVWLYVAVLFFAMLLGTHFQTGMQINSIVSNMNMLLGSEYGRASYGIYIFLRFFSAGISVVVFELLARGFYYLTNNFTFGALNMGINNFMRILRVFEILKYAALALLNLAFYFANFLIPIGITVISFAVSTAAYFLFFIYLNKHYLDPKAAHRVFRVMAVIYIMVSVFKVIGGLI